MKIFFLIDGFGRGGRERQLCILLKNIVAIADIELFIFSDNIQYDIPLDKEKIHICTLETAKSLKNFVLFVEYIKKEKPDIIHFFDNISSLYALVAKIVYRVKLIDGSIRYAGKLRPCIKWTILKKIRFFFADRIIANSYQGLRVEGLQQSKKAITIHNGIDIREFRNKSNKEVKDFPKIPPDSIKVVMLGRFYTLKDYATYIKVAEKIVTKFDNIYFFCIGDGPDREKVENSIGNILNQRLFFLGNRSDISTLIIKMDIGVLLNNTNGHAEGISNAIMEYMVAKLPVIATNAGGTPELVKDGFSGFLVPAFDERIIFNKLKFLIENPKISNEFGKKGQRIINNEFSIEKMKKSYEKVYRELIHGK